MKFRNLALACAAFGLVAAPVAAETIRVAAPTTGQSELEGNSSIFYLLGAAAIIAGIIIVASDDDPASA